MTHIQDPDAPQPLGPRRVWSKKLKPSELSAIFRDYDAGMTGQDICTKYRVSKTTLYRWINEYEARPQTDHDPTFLRAHIADLERCIVKLMLKLQQLEGSDDANGVPDGGSGGGDTGKHVDPPAAADPDGLEGAARGDDCGGLRAAI